MAIKHVLLAILARQSTHGYELKRNFDQALGSLWPLQQAQVYNNLRLLEKAHLIELDERVSQENLPDQKLYRITEAGRAVLEEWLSSPVPTKRQLKDDFYLKLVTLVRVFGSSQCCSLKGEPTTNHLAISQRLIELLWRQRGVSLQHLRDLESALVIAEREADDVTAALIEGAILHTEADLAWLDQVEARLVMADVDGGGK